MQIIRISILLFIFQQAIFPQIKLIELASENLSLIDSTFFNINNNREIIQIDKNWSVSEVDSEDKAKVTLPCIFNGQETLVFQKKLSISKDLAKNKTLFLRLLGANYFTEILFNSVQIFKESTANIPVSIKIPENLISTNRKNTLTIKITHKLDNKTTFPAYNRFLFPKSLAGFTREVYIYAVPKIHITKLNANSNYSSKNGRGNIKYSLIVENNEIKMDSSKNLDVVFDLINRSGVSSRIGQRNIKLKNNKIFLSGNIDVNNVSAWSPENPNYYVLRARILNSDFIKDEYLRYISFYNLEFDKDGIKLNGSNFEIKGCVYQREFSYSKVESEYEVIRKKLLEIKNLGFNSVRFAKAAPHTYALNLCEKLGLLASVEIPIDSSPESFFEDVEYKTRLDQYLNNFANEYRNFSAIGLISLGNSYLSDSKIHLENIRELRNKLAQKFSAGFYASFVGIPERIDFLDLTGIEVYAKNIKDVFHNKHIDKRYFISDASYPNYVQTSSGYLNEFSIEAQAKFFEDIIDFSNENLCGYFINSINHYSGDFPSLYTKFQKQNFYNIGITSNQENKLTENVITSKLKGLERVVIPIGTASTDFPLFIIFAGLTLAILLGLLVNSKKKFREDATRAFLRPYNFFADIRDHRVLSGFHTNALMIILAGIHSLLITNILYYFKNNILFEKILLSFGSPSLVAFFAELAWNPIKSFIYFFIITIIIFFAIAILIKLMSMFLKTKVMFFNIYYIVVWSFIPLSVLLPLKLILYRVLSENVINLYIYIFLLLYLIWIFQRILKGTYVIFDISRGKVYLWGLIFFVGLFGGFLLYNQMYNSTISYIILAVKQYNLL